MNNDNQNAYDIFPHAPRITETTVEGKKRTSVEITIHDKDCEPCETFNEIKRSAQMMSHPDIKMPKCFDEIINNKSPSSKS